MNTSENKTIVIVGGGPAGLMAAETLATAGLSVTVYERKPSLGRKFLLAGRGGLNLTHSEDLDTFLAKYGAAAAHLAPAVRAFSPVALREWCEGLGEPTFIGTSGRVFPKSMKASPLLRAWQMRLSKLGVRFVMQHEWTGWDDAGDPVFRAPNGKTVSEPATATLLALGGASWPKLGADGGWVDIVKGKGIPVAPLVPANCGFVVNWSEVFREKFAGSPLKPVTLSFGGQVIQGEAMITARGIEGGAVYALSSALRDAITANGSAELMLDLRPGVSEHDLGRRLSAPRQAKSFTNFLRVVGSLSPLAINLLREANKDAAELTATQLAHLIKALPIKLDAPLPIDRAISTAGGISFDALNDRFMLKKLPGVFVAGEMVDWEAPTGGYLLQACFSTAVAAARGINEFTSDTAAAAR